MVKKYIDKKTVTPDGDTIPIGYSSKKYVASFAGFFPADEPKYSCIIMINKPNKKLGYYGSSVAGPVFKNIAEKIMSKYPNQLEFSLAEIERGLISNKITSTNQWKNLKPY